jgi:hypothetical protein
MPITKKTPKRMLERQKALRSLRSALSMLDAMPEPKPAKKAAKKAAKKVAKKAPKKAVRVAPPGGEDEARELVLYIENTESLYRRLCDVDRMRFKKLEKGRFNPERAVVGYMPLVTDAAKRYAREIAGSGQWTTMFTVPTRKLAAREFAESVADRFRSGDTTLC